MHGRPDRIAALLERLGRLIATDGHEQELKPVQWETLRYLLRANRFSRTPGALTAYLGSTKGTVSQTLIALERRGLLRKRGSPDDRRVVRLELTAAGKRLLGRDPLIGLQAALGRLPARDRRLLESSLDRVLLDRLAARDRAPFGQCATCRHFETNAPEGDPHRCGLLEVTLSDDDSGLICAEHSS